MCVLKIESNQKVFTWHISFHWSADEDLTTLFEMRMRLLSECATVLSSYSDYFWHLKSVCVCVWLWSSEDPDMDWHVRHGALGKDKLLDWLWVKRGGGEWWWGDGVWLVRAQPTSKEQSLHTHTHTDAVSHTPNRMWQVCLWTVSLPQNRVFQYLSFSHASSMTPGIAIDSRIAALFSSLFLLFKSQSRRKRLKPESVCKRRL